MFVPLSPACPLGSLYIKSTRGRRWGEAGHPRCLIFPLGLSFFFFLLELLSMVSSSQLEERLYTPHIQREIHQIG